MTEQVLFVCTHYFPTYLVLSLSTYCAFPSNDLSKIPAFLRANHMCLAKQRVLWTDFVFCHFFSNSLGMLPASVLVPKFRFGGGKTALDNKMKVQLGGDSGGGERWKCWSNFFSQRSFFVKVTILTLLRVLILIDVFRGQWATLLTERVDLHKLQLFHVKHCFSDRPFNMALKQLSLILFKVAQPYAVELKWDKTQSSFLEITLKTYRICQKLFNCTIRLWVWSSTNFYSRAQIAFLQSLGFFHKGYV